MSGPVRYGGLHTIKSKCPCTGAKKLPCSTTASIPLLFAFSRASDTQSGERSIKVLKAVDVDKALIVLADKDEIVERAASNIPNVKTTLVSTLNVYEILKYEKLILTQDALAKVEEVYN